MKTRTEYIDSKCSHAEYYGQFVTPAIVELVRAQIGAKRIKRSTDKYLNDIPLRRWDALHPRISRLTRDALKAAGDSLTLSSSVCIAKVAANQIKSEMNDKTTTAPEVSDVRLPIVNCGFRSGNARAVVGGQHQRLTTSRSAETDYQQHVLDVTAQFAGGKGERDPAYYEGEWPSNCQPEEVKTRLLALVDRLEREHHAMTTQVARLRSLNAALAEACEHGAGVIHAIRTGMVPQNLNAHIDSERLLRAALGLAGKEGA